MSRLRALDGIRAFAVVAVVLAHSHFPLVRNGGVGVDVFFALSGYLITTLLLREKDRTGRISRRGFYRRRALRLLPALGVTIVVTAVLDLTARRGGGHLAAALPAVVLYYGNWLAAHNPFALGFFGQTWSLAIEEQFYIVWPLLLVVSAVRRRLTMFLGGYIVVALAAKAVLWHQIGGPSLLWTPTRATELAYGALLAAVLHRRALPSWLTGTSLAIAAAAITAGIAVVAPSRSLLPLYLPDVAAVCATVVIAHVVTHRSSPVTRVLELRPLVKIGEVSYGVYLYHYAILLWLFGYGVGRWETITVAWPLTALLVAASWRLIERPALARKNHPARQSAVATPAAMVALATVSE